MSNIYLLKKLQLIIQDAILSLGNLVLNVIQYKTYLFIIYILPVYSSKETVSHNFFSIIWSSTKAIGKKCELQKAY